MPVRRELVGPFGSDTRGRPEDCRAGKLQDTMLLGSQQSPRDAAIVDLGAEENKLALDHVLGVQPILRRNAAVEAPGPLGDDALQSKLRRMLEEQGAVAVGVVAELHR